MKPTDRVTKAKLRPEQKRTRVQTGFTLAPEAHAILEAKAQLWRTTYSRALDRILFELAESEAKVVD